MSIVKVDTRLTCMLRDIEVACESHRSLTEGLLYWQSQVFGRWHFGDGEENRFNPFWLREDALAVPSGSKWRASPRPIVRGVIRGTVCSCRSNMPAQIVEAMIVHGRREAEALLVLYESLPVGAWREPLVVAQAPVLKKEKRKHLPPHRRTS